MNYWTVQTRSFKKYEVPRRNRKTKKLRKLQHKKHLLNQYQEMMVYKMQEKTLKMHSSKVQTQNKKMNQFCNSKRPSSKSSSKIKYKALKMQTCCNCRQLGCCRRQDCPRKKRREKRKGSGLRKRGRGKLNCLRRTSNVKISIYGRWA